MKGDAAEQRRMHAALEDALGLGEDEVLTGWVVLYETANVDGRGSAGHCYGPEGMSTWRALGLCEWASRYTLGPDDPDEGDE